MQSGCRVAVSLYLSSTYTKSIPQWKVASNVLELSCSTVKRCINGRATTTSHNPLHRWEGQQGAVLDPHKRVYGASKHAQLAWSSHARQNITTSSAPEPEPSTPTDAASAERLRLAPAGQRIEVCTDGFWVWDVKVSPDGKKFATASDFLRLWDAATGCQERRCDVPSEPDDTYSSSWQVYSIAWSPEGRMIAACPTDHTCRVWDVATGAIMHELKDHVACPAAVAWSPDGRMLATGSYDNIARVYDVATGAVVHELKAHERTAWCVRWSPDGNTLATGSWDHSAALWDISTGSLIHRLSAPVASQSAGDVAPVGGSVPTGHAAPVKAMAWSPDGHMLATGSDDYTVIVWDVVTGGLMYELAGHHNAISCVAWSADGRTLATSSYDGTVRLQDMSAGALMHVLKGYEGSIVAPVSAIEFNPSGSLLASASLDGSVKLWDVSRGELLQELTGHTGVSTLSRSAGKRVNSIVWSHCGQYVYSASVDGTVRICKVQCLGSAVGDEVKER